jgi:cytochrome P450/acyl carrier protein
MTFLRNGDDHRTARRALGLAISRVPFRELEPMIDEMAGSLAADVARRRCFDAVKDFADVLPSRVMTRILGLPESDADLLREIGDDIARTFDIVSLSVYQDLDLKAERALKHLCQRVQDAVAAGQENGVTVLYNEGGNAPDDKVMATAALILFAFAVGSVTTSSLLAFAIDLLLECPDLYARARDDTSLAAAVAAEAGRLQSPVQRALRVATEDRVVGGKPIKRGQRLILLMGAANRDPDAFSQPDSACVPRDESRDLVFGAGRHVCLGMNLARIEARLALTHFLSLPLLERDAPATFRSGVTVREIQRSSIMTMSQTTDRRLVSSEEIRALLIAEVAYILKLEQAEIDPSKGFDEYGLDSVAGVVLLNAVEESIGMELEPEVVMRGRCINEIVDTLANIEIVASSAA